MHHKIILVGSIFFTCMGVLNPSIAQDNIQQMLLKCTTATVPNDQFYCYGRVTATFEMLALNGETVAQYNKPAKSLLSICGVRPPPSYGAQVQVFVNWANNHPEKWRHTDLEGVMQAMLEKWPCR